MVSMQAQHLLLNRTSPLTFLLQELQLSRRAGASRDQGIAILQLLPLVLALSECEWVAALQSQRVAQSGKAEQEEGQKESLDRAGWHSDQQRNRREPAQARAGTRARTQSFAGVPQPRRIPTSKGGHPD